MGREELPAWAVALRKERQRHGWSQLKLAVELEKAADRLQHPCPTRESLIRMIRGWENGEHKPTEENAMLLAAALGAWSMPSCNSHQPSVTTKPHQKRSLWPRAASQQRSYMRLA